MVSEHASFFVLPDRLEHLQHRYREFLVGEGPSDLPTVLAIEFNRCCIRLDNAKAQCFVAASDYFSFRFGEETPAHSLSAGFALNPQIIKPFSAYQSDPDNLFVYDSDPGQLPALVVYGKRWRSPNPAVNLIHNCLDECPNRTEFLELGSSDAYFGH